MLLAAMEQQPGWPVQQIAATEATGTAWTGLPSVATGGIEPKEGSATFVCVGEDQGSLGSTSDPSEGKLTRKGRTAGGAGKLPRLPQQQQLPGLGLERQMRLASWAWSC